MFRLFMLVFLMVMLTYIILIGSFAFWHNETLSLNILLGVSLTFAVTAASRSARKAPGTEQENTRSRALWYIRRGVFALWLLDACADLLYRATMTTTHGNVRWAVIMLIILVFLFIVQFRPFFSDFVAAMRADWEEKMRKWDEQQDRNEDEGSLT